MEKEAFKVLKLAFGEEISTHILDSFKEIQGNFLLKKWKPSELDAGHFVESVRRAIEKELFNNYTPFKQKLSNFDNAVLQSYERAKGDESFRIIIPRALKSIYNIRSKRGVGHVGMISPNEMDATYILYTVKWILAEVIRLKSNFSIIETQKLVNSIVKRQVEILWEIGEINRVLDSGMPAKDQVLVLLSNESPLNKSWLLRAIEYKNPTDFYRKVLKPLHQSRFIEYDKQSGDCFISPTGTMAAEKIILAKK
ncbi:MAG: hypothetical protein A2175_02695 [Candidatus Nealsonbacteria bacterium RBG_13_42_11]|uniref:Uncharacterized protein n=1 Tax=Candidatus Nealsonbacteria bacterium RBG_13_42_11 TaxID=1801663 RepID=A0A1G2DYH0_9BACT|nr:MAG: hypothetical protein A2175_02695 [Candidatus Nealsonbacteria bacterium RBG_13_42_11]